MSDNCYKPNLYNPMGNFLPFDRRDRSDVCDVPIAKHYSYLTPKGEAFDDTFKLNFNPNPVTTSYPDSTGFAHYLFKDPSRCRDTGYLCVTNADQTRNLDRMGYNYHGPNDKYYQEINSKNSNVNKDIIYYFGGRTN
jgi:hypothetical protein